MRKYTSLIKVGITREQTSLKTLQAQQRFRNMLLNLFKGDHSVVCILNEHAMHSAHFDVLNALAEEHQKLVFIEQSPQVGCDNYFKYLNSVLSKESKIAMGYNDLKQALQESDSAHFWHFDNNTFFQQLPNICINKASSVISLIRAKKSFQFSSYEEIEDALKERIAAPYFALGFVIDDTLTTDFELDLFTFKEETESRYPWVVAFNTIPMHCAKEPICRENKLVNYAQQLGDNGAFRDIEFRTIKQLTDYLTKQACQLGTDEQFWSFEPQHPSFKKLSIEDASIDTYHEDYNSLIALAEQVLTIKKTHSEHEC